MKDGYSGMFWWLALIIIICVCGYIFPFDSNNENNENNNNDTVVEEPYDTEELPLDEPKDEEGVRHEGVSVLFETAKADLDEEDKQDIDRIMKDVNKDTIITITIDGYADSRGTYDYNMVLSENRAVAVCTYITTKYNISDESIKIKGHSEDNPVGDNSTEEGRRLNRRADIVIKFYDNKSIE